nr:MAG TPA: hypothetical protein [Caudoviricetes sp.]
MDEFLKVLANLLKVKSLVTIILTVTFAVLAFQGHMETKDFYSVIVMVLTFYFGAQSVKKDGENL